MEIRKDLLKYRKKYMIREEDKKTALIDKKQVQTEFYRKQCCISE
jgi:hypothetical protein